jgi:hypothetical protein
MPLIVEIASVDLLDRPANVTSFRIPRHVIADLKFLRHLDTSGVPAKRYKAVPTASSECYFLRFPVLPASFGARWAT